MAALPPRAPEKPSPQPHGASHELDRSDAGEIGSDRNRCWRRIQRDVTADRRCFYPRWLLHKGIEKALQANWWETQRDSSL
jgi:hypothetical protein